MVVVEEQCGGMPALAIELKWGQTAIGDKDRRSLLGALHKLGVLLDTLLLKRSMARRRASMRSFAVLFLSFAALNLAQAAPCPSGTFTYWQAPVADNAANPPPTWIQRCESTAFPTTNDPATLDVIEVINPGTNPQKYLRETAWPIAPDANGQPQLLHYIIPFATKRSTSLKLI